MTVTSQKKQKRTLPLLPSNLVSLLPSVGVLEGIRMDKGWKREVEALETNKVDKKKYTNRDLPASGLLFHTIPKQQVSNIAKVTTNKVLVQYQTIPNLEDNDYEDTSQNKKRKMWGWGAVEVRGGESRPRERVGLRYVQPPKISFWQE